MRTGGPRIAAWCSLVVFCVILTGCFSPQKRGRDAPDTPEPTAQPNRWSDVKTTTDASGILIQRVTYRTDDLEIQGQVCRPKKGGRHPVLIWNHGGFSGLDDWDDLDGRCASAAKLGWVLAESSYRGEDGSDGRIEVCQGEVSDVLSLLGVVRGQSYADRDRVAMVGLSHGGCVTARAVDRGARVQVAVDIAGPTDWAEAWRFLSSEMSLPANRPARRAYVDLLATIEKGIGGTPAEVPDGYASRSPLQNSSNLARGDTPFLIVHGGADAVVPLRQSCRLADRLGVSRAYRFDDSGDVVSKPPGKCKGLTWDGPPSQAQRFPDDRYLLVYDGVDHFLQGDNGQRVTPDYLRFIASKLED